MSHRLLLLGFIFLACFQFAQAQEEEEGTPKKPAKKIDVPEDVPVSPPVPNPPEGSATLENFLAKFAAPHDRITLANGRVQRIVPVPLLFGKDKFPDEFGVQPLDERNEIGDAQTLTPGQVKSLIPFEHIAILETEALLKLPANATNPPRKARLLAAEKALGQALFFHVGAVEKERRIGKNWGRWKTALNDKLLEVRLAVGTEAAATKDWKALREWIARCSERYRSQPEVLVQFAAMRLLEAEDAAGREKLADWEYAQALLREFESLHPMNASDIAKRVRTTLASKAKTLLEQARKIISTNPAEASNLLRTVETLAPGQPGLQELRSQLKSESGTLVVGTRRIPEKMSPALARFDSEQQVVELLFEGLLEPIPDAQLGTNYRLGLTSAKPRVITGGRKIEIVTNAEWTDAGNSPLTARDVLATLQMQRERPESVGNIAGNVSQMASEGNVLNLSFRSLPPDPRAWLTFKVLPGRWMIERKLAWDDEAFARNPIGSGPFRLPPGYVPPQSGIAPSDFRLIANAEFSKRYPGTPGIREIRYSDVAPIRDLVNEVRSDRIHVLTDVPTAELPNYEALPNATVATAANPHRIQILAINHRIAALQNPEVRRGIQAAIQREAILNDVFRAGQKQYHRALTGPFPPDSWAVPKGAASLDRASTKIVTAATPLTLIYPMDDPLAKAACDRIAKQVSDAGLALIAEGVLPRMFVLRLESEHRYDLAYTNFDYPDDWYPQALAQLLDGSASNRGGRNFLGYLAPKTNASVADRQFSGSLSNLLQSRDFDGVWKPRAQEIHAKFAEVVPFVPLWQLDRHTVVSKRVKMPFPAQLLNPTTLFADVRNWKFVDGK